MKKKIWLLALFVAAASAQDAIDSKLMDEIHRIRAIDNHTHIDAVDENRPARWHVENPVGVSRYPDVVPLARDHADWRMAWRALYGYSYTDMALPHLQDLLGRKGRSLARYGDGWPGEVLDQARIDIALVNAVRLGPGLTGAKFRWVPYGDPLLRPFAGDKSWLLFAGGDLTIVELLKEAGLSEPPATLALYRQQVIEATLQRWKANRAVAVKFLSAYARGLDFDPVEENVAAPLYLKGRGGAALTAAEQKTIEDYLFNEIAAAAGRAGLVVHVHTGNGDGPYFNNRRANPDLLENAINSRPLRDTKFVLLHGGWPYARVAQAMTDKPNTYVDFSAETFYLDTHHLAEVLRGWLAWHPEKVLFGSDAYSDVDSPLVDWEEKQFVTTHRSRRALGIALTAMMDNQEISRPRALEIARMVLRDNAAKLYGLGP